MSDKKNPDDLFAALSPEEASKMEAAVKQNLENLAPAQPAAAGKTTRTWPEVVSQLNENYVFEVVKTDTISAKISQLPCSQLALDFLVEVLTPIHLTPRFMSVGFGRKELNNDLPTACREMLKTELLREWQDHFKESEELYLEKVPDWVKEVNKVELIECDLLVPKEKKP